MMFAHTIFDGIARKSYLLRLMESRPLERSTPVTSQPVMTQAEATSHMMTSAMLNQSALAIE
eukprot:1191704-Ditylum_brightwellii.AAC.2